MERIYENNRFNVLAPQSVTDAAVTSAYIDMQGARRFAAVVTTDALGEGESVKVEILEATKSDGTGAKAITGATATVTDTVTGPAIVEVHTDNMTDEFTHLAIKATVTGTALVAAVGISSDLQYEPPTQTGVVVAPQIS